MEYTDENIRHLSDMEHVRTRPGMYIGKLGDGSQSDDGIYVLLKEIIDNSIDEFKMNAGKRIEVDIVDDKRVSVRDYGRGIPQGKLIEAVSVLNTGGKYDSKAFKKSVGLNGVGAKAVNALSTHFEVRSYRDGKVRTAIFERGNLLSDITADSSDESGTAISFEPDDTIFTHYAFQPAIVETMLRNYTYLNTGLAIMYNGRRILSRNGLVDLLTDRMTAETLYPIVHLKGEDIEIAFTHTNQYGEEYYSFVNGQHTTQGGTHQSAFKEHIARTIKEFFNKPFEYSDIRSGMVAAIAINVEEPVFESQTKVKLGSTTMTPNGGMSLNKFVGDFIKNLVPESMAQAFSQQYQSDYATLVHQVYLAQAPARFLGGLAPFILSFYDKEEYAKNLVDNNFRRYFHRNVCTYDPLPLGVVGGFGHACRSILMRIGQEEFDIPFIAILPSPLEGLLKYHGV